jgi:hypothetical protein
MTLRVHVASLVFPDGTVEELPSDGITVIVGPNNVGKTAILRDIVNLLTNPPQPHNRPIILADIELVKQGSDEDLDRWFRDNGFPARLDSNYNDGRAYYGSRQQNPLPVAEAKQLWSQKSRHTRLSRLQEFLVAWQATETRLGLLGGAQLHDPVDDNPRQPLQRLVADEALLTRYESLVKRAFDIDVSVNPYGPQLELKIGKPVTPIAAPPHHVDFLRESRTLPLASQQGDGVRSFLGLVLQAIVTAQPIVVVDEPEAFLHPPQARLIGRILAEETPSESQIIIATHSLDVLQGILESSGRPIKVLRVTRDASHSITLTALRPDEVTEALRDPLLRFSDLLDGLFHPGVVLCEADSDCRFYSASIELMRKGETNADLLFSHVSGKARLPKAISQLRRFGVPVAAIADFDLLNDSTLLRAVVDSAGGTWDDFKADYILVARAVNGLGSGPSVSAVRERVRQLFDNLDDTEPVSRTASKNLIDVCRVLTGWDQVKRSGLAGLPQGEPATSGQRLLSALQDLGVFVVPVGELERWVPVANGKSASWLLEVFDRDLYRTPGPQLQDFLSAVVRAARPDL